MVEFTIINVVSCYKIARNFLMVLIPWSQVASTAPELGSRVASGIRDGVCNFRRNNPFLFDPISTTFPNLPTSRFNRGFWDEICSANPLPGSYPTPTSGGQCPVQYRWFVDWSTPTVEATRQDPFNSTYLGPISNPRFTFTRINNNTQTRIDFFFTPANLPEQTFFIGNGDANATPFVRAVRFVRVDGQADNCGTIPIVRNVLPPINNTFNTSINIGGVQTSVDITLGDINVVAGNVTSFRPVFNTSIGEVVFTLGGVDINLNPNIVIGGDSEGGSDVDLNPVLNAIDEAEINLSTQISEVITNIENLGTLIEGEFDSLEDLIRCCCCGENVTFQSTIIASSTEGGLFSLPDKCVALSIVADQPLTPGTKIQYGSGAAPNVFYWGWYSIGSDANNPGDRRELHYANQAVFLPQFAKSVTVNPIYTNKATIVAIIRQPCG
jgi:hypothetical protein